MRANSGVAGWTYLGATPAAPSRPMRLVAEIQKMASPIRRRRIVADAIEKEVRTVLALAAPAPRAVALRDLGLDSLMAVEVRNRLERIFGLRMPSTLAFDHPTIDAIAVAIEAQLGPAEASAPTASSKQPSASGEGSMRAVSGEPVS
jgi:acyl carrier protein